MKAVTVILNSDLRSMHRGLTEQLTENGVKPIKKGEAAIFINSARNKLKALSHNGVISYITFGSSRRAIDLNAMNEIARAFNPDGTLDYARALKAHLEKHLAMKKLPTTDAIKL